MNTIPERDEKVNARTIISGLGGNHDTGMCCCPAHEDHNPSFKVSDEHGKVLVRCFAGCFQEVVISALRARGLWGQRSTDILKRHARNSEDGDEKFEHAFTILRRAAYAKEGPVAYFKGRSIELKPPAAMLLPPKDCADLTGKRYPGMVFPILSKEGKLQGAHVTWLNSDATAKLPVSDGKPRRIYGQLKGSYVPLGITDPDKPLIVGEGIETTLSAMQLAGLPGVAGFIVSNSAFEPPPCSEIIVAANNDEPGLRAAARLAERLRFEGRIVRIAIPPAEGEDWNDRLCSSRAAQDEWRAALAKGDPDTSSGPISALDE